MTTLKVTYLLAIFFSDFFLIAQYLLGSKKLKKQFFDIMLSWYNKKYPINMKVANSSIKYKFWACQVT